MIPQFNTDVLFQNFNTIDIKKIQSVNLNNRTETKYLIPIQSLEVFLKPFCKSHLVLKINNTYIQTYRSCYYDTSDMKMYVAHHNKKANRFKIRTRQYIESNLFFLEIKNKTNKGKTAKKRIKLKSNSIKNCTKSEQFISDKSPYKSTELSAVLGNTFQRITLVDNALTERLTIDINLKAWEVGDENNNIHLPNIAIIELKRDANSIADTHKRLLKLRIKSMGFSKYAIASSILFSKKIKNNNFKKKQRRIEKLSIIK
jgi:hypothetical protein